MNIVLIKLVYGIFSNLYGPTGKEQRVGREGCIICSSICLVVVPCVENTNVVCIDLCLMVPGVYWNFCLIIEAGCSKCGIVDCPFVVFVCRLRIFVNR